MEDTEHKHPPQGQCSHVLWVLQLIVSALVMSYWTWIFLPVFLLAHCISGGWLLAVMFPGNLGTLRSSIMLASPQREQTQSIRRMLAKCDVRVARKIREIQHCLAKEECTDQPVPHLALKRGAQPITQDTALRLLTLCSILHNSKGILQKRKWKTCRKDGQWSFAEEEDEPPEYPWQKRWRTSVEGLVKFSPSLESVHG